ncbi:hypothetical protein GCM10010319_27540 [Streptomyces blastmyceticus]|uniref:Uncharacterized protein n=1 Tax=Streptomyces blastmyceticus TaxID=68180 RepID=A0ABN0WX98_9ACTN
MPISGFTSDAGSSTSPGTADADPAPSAFNGTSNSPETTAPANRPLRRGHPSRPHPTMTHSPPRCRPERAESPAVSCGAASDRTARLITLPER